MEDHTVAIYFAILNRFLNQTPVFGNYANSADTVQTPPNAPNAASESDLVLHCLLTEISMENEIKVKTSTRNP